MNKKILTIAVPSFNAEKYLVETIPTVLNLKNIELVDLIIINDGSKDDTLSVANKMKRDYPNIIQIVDKENGGHGSAVNSGIKYAKGKYFKVLDADDWVDTENLDKLIEYLKITDIDEIVSPYYKVIVDSKGDIINSEEYNEFDKIEDQVEYTADEFFCKIGRTVGMHTITMKTEILKNNNIVLTENMFYVDMEYITYILPYIKNIVLFNMPIYKYRLGTQTQSVSDESYERNRDMHKQVIYNLINFYEKLSTSKSIKKVIRKLIVNLIGKQWEIYYNMSDIELSKKDEALFKEKLLNSGLYGEYNKYAIGVIKIKKYVKIYIKKIIRKSR